MILRVFVTSWPKVGKYPAASLLKAVAQKSPNDTDDETLVLADQAQKAMKQVRERVAELLQGKVPPEKVDQLSQLLSQGTWTHDHPITFEKAKELGLPVSSQMPDDFMKLMSLFPQPVRQQSPVEYLPIPRTRKTQPES